MGADHAVDVTVLESGHDLVRLALGEKARKCLHANRITGEPLGERIAVLRGEQGGGNEYSDLFAVLDRFERGPNGDFGLAETDVTANEPIHRVRTLHVGLHFVDRFALIGGFDERERVLHGVLPRCIGGEGVALGGDSLLVEHHEFLSDLADGALHPRFRFGEVGAT